MIFNTHYNLKGQHAYFGASKYHCINYDEERIANAFMKMIAVQKGTKYHEIAAQLIEEGIKLPKSNKTLNMYVNDAIGFKMIPEQVLYYSENCFGTADAICFRDNVLRIHDLKTGEIPAHMEQLLIYAALFCLEYHIKPGEIKFELRIYQNDEKIIFNPTAPDILPIMDQIVRVDKIVKQIKNKEDNYGIQ